MKQRIYLDTSVLSALDDPRLPDRAASTREFWSRRADFDLYTSELTTKEIADTNVAARRTEMTARLAELTILPLTDEMRSLARLYVDVGIFSEAIIADALHVAAAVLTRCDVLLSWNFKHLVNRRRKAAVTAINLSRGLPAIDICAPVEL